MASTSLNLSHFSSKAQGRVKSSKVWILSRCLAHSRRWNKRIIQVNMVLIYNYIELTLKNRPNSSTAQFSYLLYVKPVFPYKHQRGFFKRSTYLKLRNFPWQTKLSSHSVWISALLTCHWFYSLSSTFQTTINFKTIKSSYIYSYLLDSIEY